MAPSRINNLNFRNSQLNYTYSINFLIKKIKKLKNYLRKNILNLKKKSCFKFVFLTKNIQGKKLTFHF